MPVPSSIDDLSTTAASNSPTGSETPTEGDNYLRTLSAFIAALRDKLDGTSATGTLTTPTVTGDSTASYILTPAVSAVIAYRAAQTNYAAGTNTLILNTEVADRGGDYDTATGIFTAPKTGLYEARASLKLRNQDTSDPLSLTTLPHISKNNSASDPNICVLGVGKSASNRLEALERYQATGSALFSLTAGDTLRINATHSGEDLWLETGSTFSVNWVG